MSLRDQLRSIYEQRGALTPAVVVDEARDEAHPLHGRFEWDDSVAGEKYRQVQAAEMIRSVKVVYRDEPTERSVRGFVSVERVTDEARRSYVPVEEAVSDGFTRALLLRECEREWKTFRAKYEHLNEFSDIVAGERSAGAA